MRTTDQIQADVDWNRGEWSAVVTRRNDAITYIDSLDRVHKLLQAELAIAESTERGERLSKGELTNVD